MTYTLPEAVLSSPLQSYCYNPVIKETSNLSLPQLKLNSSKTTACIAYSNFTENNSSVTSASMYRTCSQDATADIQLLAQAIHGVPSKYQLPECIPQTHVLYILILARMTANTR